MDHDPRLEPVWEAMAEHFLDTETRHDVPTTALRCLEAGLHEDDAFAVWCFEVTPVLWPNLWDVAGEWACWPRAWLLEQVAAARAARAREPGLLSRCCYHARIGASHAVWLAIAQSMALLAAVATDQREAACAQLAALARCYFDFVPRPLTDRTAAARWWRAFAPVLASLSDAREAAAGTARVEAALGTDAGIAG